MSMFRSCLFLVVTLLCTSFVLVVDAQKSSQVRIEFATPEFDNPHTIVAIVIGGITIPAYAIGVFLLYRRRKYFPIAGRGAWYLLALGTFLFLAAASFTGFGLVYPFGLPCGIEFMTQMCLAVPIASIYFLRGLTLVFRLEILNFLAESRWRKERKAELEAHASEQGKKEASQEEENQKQMKIDAKPATGVTRIFIDPKSEVDANEEDDLSTIPGYWFIHHRNWMEFNFLRWPILACVVVLILCCTLLATFDPDVDLTTANLRREGLLAPGEPGPGNQFASPDSFFHSPVCLSYSIKSVFFEVVLGCAFLPLWLWSAYCIYIDKQRKATRKKEQEELHKLIHGSEPARAELTTTVNGLRGIDMDDSNNVKMELFLLVFMIIFISISYYPVVYFEPAYQFVVLQTAYIYLFILSIVEPLRISFAVSRHHRRLFDQNAAANGEGGIKPYNRLPHQRPYFTLKYIIRQADTYPVLLAFLQKEYSSENALFWTETQEFERAAKALEAKIPSWPSCDDDDADADLDEYGVGSGVDAGGKPLAAFSTGGVASTVSPIATPIGSPVARGGSGALGFNRSRKIQPAPMKTISGIPLHLRPTIAQERDQQRELPSPLALQRINRLSTDDAGPHSDSISTVRSLTPDLATPSPPRTPVHVALQGAASPPSQGKRSLATYPTSGAGGPSTRPAVYAGSRFIAVPDNVDFPALHAEAARLQAWAHRIQQLYLVRSSMYEVNLQQDLIKLVASQIAQLDSWHPTPVNAHHPSSPPDTSFYPLAPPFRLSTLYRQTSMSVFELIQRDSFRRFILTSAFQELLARADQAELARLEKQADLLDTNVHDKALAELNMPTNKDGSGTKMVAITGSGKSVSGGERGGVIAGGSLNRGVHGASHNGVGHSQQRSFHIAPACDNTELLPGSVIRIASTPIDIISVAGGSVNGASRIRHQPSLRYVVTDREGNELEDDHPHEHARARTPTSPSPHMHIDITTEQRSRLQSTADDMTNVPQFNPQ